MTNTDTAEDPIRSGIRGHTKVSACAFGIHNSVITSNRESEWRHI